MMRPLRSFDDVDGKERGQKKTDGLRAMTTLGPRTYNAVKWIFKLSDSSRKCAAVVILLSSKMDYSISIAFGLQYLDVIKCI